MSGTGARIMDQIAASERTCVRDPAPSSPWSREEKARDSLVGRTRAIGSGRRRLEDADPLAIANRDARERRSELNARPKPSRTAARVAAVDRGGGGQSHATRSSRRCGRTRSCSSIISAKPAHGRSWSRAAVAPRGRSLCAQAPRMPPRWACPKAHSPPPGSSSRSRAIHPRAAAPNRGWPVFSPAIRTGRQRRRCPKTHAKRLELR